MRFCAQTRGDVIAAHKECKMAQIGAELGRQWKSLSPALKEKFTNAAAKDRAAWEQHTSEEAEGEEGK
jgi:hypothetical protein